MSPDRYPTGLASSAAGSFPRVRPHLVCGANGTALHFSLACKVPDSPTTSWSLLADHGFYMEPRKSCGDRGGHRCGICAVTTGREIAPLSAKLLRLLNSSSPSRWLPCGPPRPLPRPPPPGPPLPSSPSSRPFEPGFSLSRPNGCCVGAPKFGASTSSSPAIPTRVNKP